MANERDDDLIKIRKREKKPKPEKPKKEKMKPKRDVPPKSAPKANGVKLDFSQEEAPQYTKYYMSVSKRYRAARVISIALLICFLLVMLVFFRENITYANLMYLVRDLDTDTAVNIGVYSDISYDKVLSRDFGLFRQRIAVASSGGFSLYSSTGSEDLYSSDVVADPRLEVGDKYALMYDEGSNKYSVYTTVARVLSAKTEFEILDGAVSDSGSYALVTETDEAKALITVYSQDFRVVTEYYKDKYVLDVALDSEGEHICAASVDVQLSGVVCELMIGKVGTKDSAVLEYPGMMPIQAEYTDDGRLFVLCDSALLVFDGEKEIERVDFEGLTPGSFAIEGNVAAVTFPTNAVGSESTLRVFNTEGKELISERVDQKVSAVAADGEDTVYVICESEAVRVLLTDKKTKTEEINGRVIGAVAVPGSLVICFPDGTASYFTD